MGSLALRDWLLLGIIGVWMINVCIKLYKGKRSGQCIGCSGQCKNCQHIDTKNKKMYKK